MTKIAACLIVKNSAGTIEKCLASIRPHVDGIFIYDTGSTDDTLEVLNRLNAKTKLYVIDGVAGDALPEDADEVPIVMLAPITVQQGEWRDDFAWAREQSFAMPDETFDWLIWLDDDDEIVGAENLRMLAERADPQIDGFVAIYDYARDENGNCVCVLWRERLIRRAAGLEWKNAIHEVLVHPARAPHLAQLPAEILRYVHSRPLDRYAPDRNLQILRNIASKAETEGMPVDARTLAYLGTELMARGEWQEAAQHLQAYLDRDDIGWSDERMQVAHKLAMCARILGNSMAAVEIEMLALRERDDWPETYVGLTEAFADLGQWDRVERWAKRAIELGAPQTSLIVNPLEFSVLPALRLAQACQEQGRLEDAEQWLTQAAQAAPGMAAVRDRIDDLAQTKLTAEALRGVLTLREILVRHDENEKAYQLLEHSVPYIVAEHPQVVKARADQREMVKHLTHSDEYRRWYEDEPKDSTITDELLEEAGNWIGRVQGLLRGVKEQEIELGRPPRVLDLGCNDWWMGEYFARQGFRVDGVELNKRSFEKAIERRDRFERDATIVQGDLHDAVRLLSEAGGSVAIMGDDYVLPPHLRYDAVAMFEVFEHVPDTKAALEVMESLLAPGGRVYVSTPSGAFERGNIEDWARVTRKGHLRALPMNEFTDLLLDRGDIDDLDEHNNVAFASYTPRPLKGTVTFFAGSQWEPWSPLSLREGGIGGSETALVQVATRMARAGWKVKVYSSSEPGLIGGVLYRPFTAWDPTDQVDLLVVSRIAHVFDEPIGATSTALWCHDHSYDGLTEERAAKIDHIVVLSDWQRERFERLYPWTTDRLRVIRNGITRRDFDGKSRYPNADRGFAKRKPRAIYSSSADRGLDVLLDLWPRILENVPAAELHVFYGFDTLDRVAAVSPQLAAFKQAILAKVNELGGEDAGVFLRGRVGQLQLAAEMQEARVLAYPTAFLETSCITAMEAQAAGLPIVTSDLGALHETARNQTLLPWSEDEAEPHNRTGEYQDAFVYEVTRALAEDGRWRAFHNQAVRDTDGLDWSERIPLWESLAEPHEASEQHELEIVEELQEA